jgi:hypothetical protein
MEKYLTSHRKHHKLNSLPQDNESPQYQQEASPSSQVRSPPATTVEWYASGFTEATAITNTPSSSVEISSSTIDHSSFLTSVLTGTTGSNGVGSFTTSYISERVRDLKLISGTFIDSHEEPSVDAAHQHPLFEMLDDVDLKTTEVLENIARVPDQDPVDFFDPTILSPDIQKKWMKGMSLKSTG